MALMRRVFDEQAEDAERERRRERPRCDDERQRRWSRCAALLRRSWWLSCGRVDALDLLRRERGPVESRPRALPPPPPPPPQPLELRTLGRPGSVRGTR